MKLVPIVFSPTGESGKVDIHSYHEEMAYKYHFFHPFYTGSLCSEHLKDMRDIFEKRMRKRE